MFTKKFIKQIMLLWLVILFTGGRLLAQDEKVRGIVFEKNDSGSNVLPGANVFWKGTTIGTNSGADGKFEIKLPVQFPASLVVSYVGYASDTILIESNKPVEVYLKANLDLQGVTVEGRRDATVISTIDPLNTEEIGQKELLKAACCNLSESFETNPSVDVSYTDAVTGAKEIQMLGLSGSYSQVMTENIPSVRGLAATYGLNYIPGPWMESIQVTKGTGSVANGYESTSGQINVEFLKPYEAPLFYLNGYVASSGNHELNMHKTFNVSPKAKSILFLHGENMQSKWDHQDDGFLDMPMNRQANVYNRWTFNDGKKFEGQFGIKALVERRRSGQVNYNYDAAPDSTKGYGIEIETKRIEAYSKTGLIFPETPWRSVGLILSASLHDQESYFGIKNYKGTQQSLYGSLIYMSIFSTTQHKFKGGFDFRADRYEEEFLDQPFNRDEIVPGAYFEYTLDLDEKFGMVAGSRIDHHNAEGFFYTPRLHLKYNITPLIIARLSGGRSFRTANVFADNIPVMATSRELVIEEKLKPERAWNTGANVTAKFIAFYRDGSLSLDYYITSFDNQVIVDPYSSGNYIYLYNLTGNSTSKSFQAAFNYEAFKRFDVRLAYRHDDVIIDYKNFTSRKPLAAEEKFLLNLSYSSRKEKLRYDFTTHYQGEAKLAVSNNISSHGGHGELKPEATKSPGFFTYNAQVTLVLNQWEIYLGGENLSNFRQENPVINPGNPYGEGFDATNVWGPVMGRKIYTGFRYTIKPKKKSTS